MLEKEKIDLLREKLVNFMATYNKSILKMERESKISRFTFMRFLNNSKKSRMLSLARIQRYIENYKEE